MAARCNAGNEAFKKQQWEDAIKSYTKAIGLVPEESKDKAVFLNMDAQAAPWPSQNVKNKANAPYQS